MWLGPVERVRPVWLYHLLLCVQDRVALGPRVLADHVGVLVVEGTDTGALRGQERWRPQVGTRVVVLSGFGDVTASSRASYFIG